MKKHNTCAKKAAALLLSLSFLALSACGNADEKTQFNPSVTAQDSAQEQAESSPSKVPSTAKTPSASAAPVKTPAEPEVLHLDKTIFSQCEYPDDAGCDMVQVTSSCLTLTEEDAVLYPELASLLDETAQSTQENVGATFSYLANRAESQSAYSEGDFGGGSLKQQDDLLVRRADSVALSVLSSSCYEEYGEITQSRYGWNIDTQTGDTIYLNDVIRDMDALPALVEQILVDYVFGGEFSSPTAVADYFADREEDCYNWTLEYNGVTIHFNAGDIADMEYGAMSATVLFAEHPDLFEEKYMAVPDAYIVELADSVYYADVNGDGTCESIQTYVSYDDEAWMYSGIGVGAYPVGDNYTEAYAYGYNPFYVHTADGGDYMYVFCQTTYELNWNTRLLIFDLSSSDIAITGDCSVRPSNQSKGEMPGLMESYAWLTDPDLLYLDDFDAADTASAAFKVGSDGVPVRQ